VKRGSRNPVLKAMKAFAWIIQAESSDVGVREMAGELRISPSTAHRLLSELMKADLVRPSSTPGRYALSLEFFRLAYLTTTRQPIREVALTHMRRLTDSCNETSLLGLYDPVRQQMMFAAMIDSSHPLRYSIELNKWIPVHTGASGLAIMAFLSDEEISRIIERTRLAPATSRSITERYRMEAEIQKIRKRGYAITQGQRTPDAVGLAAPVFGSNGEVVGDICLTIPKSRFEQRVETRIANHLMRCAQEVTKAIGGQYQKSSNARRVSTTKRTAHAESLTDRRMA
jgi:DNA-binding IclR family transcriptional regulator